MKINKLFSIIFLGLLAVSCMDNKFNNATINLASGYQLYEKNCSNCHQSDGAGLAQLYPPLLHADYIINNPKSVDSIIKIWPTWANNCKWN